MLSSARLEEMRSELINLYELAVRHDTIIQKVETGVYNQGIVSMRIPEKDKQMATLPTQSKFPELFKTLTQEKYLKSHNAQLTRAKEVYMKNIKTLNEEKAKKNASAKDEGKLQIIDLNKIDIDKSSHASLIEYMKESIKVSAKLNKEENEYIDRLATLDKIKHDTNNKHILDLTKDRDQLRIDLQSIVKQNKQLLLTSDKQKRILDKHKIHISKYTPYHNDTY